MLFELESDLLLVHHRPSFTTTRETNFEAVLLLTENECQTSTSSQWGAKPCAEAGVRYTLHPNKLPKCVSIFSMTFQRGSYKKKLQTNLKICSLNVFSLYSIVILKGNKFFSSKKYEIFWRCK